MSEVISVDPGSSFIKAGNGRQSIRFPSVALASPGQSDQGITVEGTAYVVGEGALFAQGRPRHEPHAGAEYHGSDMQHVLICEAMRRLGSPFDAKPTLLVGLPYFLRHDRPARERVLARMREFKWTDAEGTHTVKMGDVKIIPQGGGALWGWVSDHRKEGLGMVCAIDVGGHTTDVFTLSVGDRIDADQEVQGSSGSIGCNVHEFYQRLSDRLRRLPGTGLHDKVFSYYALMEGIERGRMSLRHNGRSIDISKPFAETCVEFTQDLLKAAQDTVGDRWSELDQILLTGGGAHLVDSAVWNDPRVVRLDPNSNVSGQIRFYSEFEAALQAA